MSEYISDLYQYISANPSLIGWFISLAGLVKLRRVWRTLKDKRRIRLHNKMNFYPI
ncbi:TPA_asm: P6 [Triticum alphacytorhabdovirus 1]|nr:TPA_asm: P6 [Triticum alphacytorhabdovirus 1]